MEQLCQRLRVPNEIRDLAKLVAEFHDLIHTFPMLNPKTIVKLFDSIDAWRNRAVRGNHEQMAMDALASQQMSLWFLNGGNWFIGLTDKQREQVKMMLVNCQRLPWIIELNSSTGKHVIAHADYPSDIYEWQKEVDLHQVLWSRLRLIEGQKGQGITGADHFWFGHTPLRHRVDIGNLHYIDTGAVFGGTLTLEQLQ